MRILVANRLEAADAERRTIAGRVVTFGEVGYTSAGPARFDAGSLEVADDIRLNLEHDRTRPIGRAKSITAHKAGIDGVFSIASTRAGDDALVEAADALRDGLSVEVEVLESESVDGVLVITAGRLEGVALVTTPAIDSARVSRVAASENPPEGNAMSDPEVVETVDDETEVEAVEVVEAARTLAPVARTRPRVAPFASEVDYVLTHVKAAQGDRDAATRILAAAGDGDQKLADNPPLVPTPVVGNVIDAMNAERPIVASARRLPMPSAGKTFERPRIDQHTKVDIQAAELDPIAAQKLTMTAEQITKVTIAGQVRISFQDRDWTDPAILGIVLGDMDKVYARKTEAYAAAELQTGTGSSTLAANATSDVFVQAIYKAAGDVYAACGRMPNVIYAAPDAWARMGGLADGSKRPIFPSLAPSNAAGTLSADSFNGNPLGLRLIVSSDLVAGSIIVANSDALEVYESGPWNLSVVDVSALGFTVAKYGYFASKAIEPAAIVKVGPATP